MKTNSIVFMFLVIVFFQGCSTGNSINHRFVPPAESGDPFFGIAVKKAVGPSSVSSAETRWSKTGKASSFSILGLVSAGNAGSAEAAKNGNINQIATSEVEIFNFKLLGLPIYTKYTTIVNGN